MFKMLITAAIGAEGDESPEERGSALQSSAWDPAYDSGRPVAGRKFINNF
jgi:hypothetical protein